MAQVSFSNAKLEPLYNNLQSGYLNLEQGYFYQSNQYADPVALPTRTTVQNTPSKVSFMYSGTFRNSGTEFYLFLNNTKAWRVYNISFNANDTFSFIIDIETIGNNT